MDRRGAPLTYTRLCTTHIHHSHQHAGPSIVNTDGGMKKRTNGQASERETKNEKSARSADQRHERRKFDFSCQDNRGDEKEDEEEELIENESDTQTARRKIKVKTRMRKRSPD